MSDSQSKNGNKQIDGGLKTGLFGGAIGKFFDRLRGRNGEASLRESLEDIIETHDDNVEPLAEEERVMLKNILSFGDLRVDDVMVPRADIVALDASLALEEIVAVFKNAAHSRLPIYRETLDDPIGMVHIKDVIGFISEIGAQSSSAEKDSGYVLNKLRREILFVPPSMPVIDLLIRMQKSRIHLALVIDEYGGTDGLVSIEDLIEEIVGEIEDEHDPEAAPHLLLRADGGYDADARVSIDELEEKLETALLPADREEDVDTLGGLVFSLVGRVPQRGELVGHPAGIEFEIMDADPRRVKKLRIHRLQEHGEKLDAINAAPVASLRNGSGE
jgi:CBS domain containing-hemolysin-like protein